MTIPVPKNRHEACINWAKNVLVDNGSKGSVIIEDVAETPYSYVAKLTVNEAVYYLKKTPPDLFNEAKILGLVGECCPEASIPHIVATNKTEHCSLLESCGEKTLRKYFVDNLDMDLLSQGIHEYRLIQEKTSSHLKTFLDIGIPDWRLFRLPDIYNDLIHDEARLQEWGFSLSECQNLKDKKETFARLCKKIDTFNIPDTLNHSDFQENNMVFDPVLKKVSLIDWGEVTIGHPLLPIIGCFQKACRRYNIDPNSADYKKLWYACLMGWGIDEKVLPDIYAVLSAIGDVYYALTIAELIKNTSHHSPEWAARIKMGCLSFVTSCANL